jgi:sterol desaturase/sphingolipid hydroxylase (fatty acid hydroxylase superfamily)
MMPLLLNLLLPVSILASLAAFLYCRATGGPVELAILIASLAPLGLAMALEHLRPHRAEWNESRGDAATDWTSFAVLAGVVQPLLKWASPLIVVGVYGWIGRPAELFPAGTPFALQVLVVTLIAELGKYWVHRWHHTLPPLWWLHSLHHGTERLYAVNNFRVHPVEYAIKHTFSLLPLMLLGAPAEAILGYIAITQPVQMLQHVNLPMRHGWLNYIFSTNELHRWHHSAQRGEGDSNFGSALVLWDQVFGTFHYGAPGTEPERIGMYEQGKYPASEPFHAQVLSMFRPPCCRT